MTLKTIKEALKIIFFITAIYALFVFAKVCNQSLNETPNYYKRF